MADKVFCDPVHRHIIFEEKYRKLFIRILDSPELQRLRRIRQLGLSCYTYPGAEHTRLSHALGTFHVMTQALSALQRSDSMSTLPEEVAVAARCAALLHDIGHGPFSHLTERFSGLKHEAMSANLIMEGPAVAAALKAWSSDLPNIVLELLLPEKRSYPFISDLLSSELDVDRMDYIQRDAYFCGVSFGVYDFLRILHTMRLGSFPGEDERHPVWLMKGRHAVEEMLYSRFHMYWAVYYHRTTCGYEAIYGAILQKAKELGDRSGLEPGVDGLLDGKIDPGEFLQLDDSLMLAQISRWRRSNDKVLADLCGRFLDRRGFKPIGPVHINTDNVACVADAKEYLRNKELPPEHYLLNRRLAAVAYDYYRPDDETRKGIYLEKDTGGLEEISRLMTGVKALIEAPREENYYYVPREHGDKLAEILRPMISAT